MRTHSGLHVLQVETPQLIRGLILFIAPMETGHQQPRTWRRALRCVEAGMAIKDYTNENT